MLLVYCLIWWKLSPWPTNGLAVSDFLPADNVTCQLKQPRELLLVFVVHNVSALRIGQCFGPIFQPAGCKPWLVRCCLHWSHCSWCLASCGRSRRHSALLSHDRVLIQPSNSKEESCTTPLCWAAWTWCGCFLHAMPWPCKFDSGFAYVALP